MRKSVLALIGWIFLVIFPALASSQDLVVTKRGEIFKCTLKKETAERIHYSFLYLDRTFHASINPNEVAYAGEDFITFASERAKQSRMQDLIITKKGEVMKCHIMDYKGNIIEYAFYLGNNQLDNEIERTRIAFMKGNYLDSSYLETESETYYRTYFAGEIQAVADSLRNARELARLESDLIRRVDGRDLICAFEKADARKVSYAYHLEDVRMNGTLPREEVNYIIRNHRGEHPEKILITPVFDPDEAKLIITDRGKVMEVNILEDLPDEIEYLLEGEIESGFIKKNDLAYYGRNFINDITPTEEMVESSYRDLLYTQDGEVMQCKIGKVTDSHVEFTFKLGNRIIPNEIERDRLIYFGPNFFEDLESEELLAETPGTVREINQEQIAAEADAPEIKSEEFVETKTEKEPEETPTARKVTDTQAPVLTILEPALSDPDQFEKVPDETARITVRGRLSDESDIRDLKINSNEVSLDGNSEFQVIVELQTGNNSILFQALDSHENEMIEVYNIERCLPVVASVERAAADETPPVIRLENPAELVLSVPNTTKKMKVFGRAEDESGVFEVLINGRDAALSSTGEFSLEIPLRVGKNEIEIKAGDLSFNYATASVTISREDVEVTDRAESPEIMDAGAAYYGLLIGVSNYQDPSIPNLDNQTINDASALYNVLVNDYMFDKENVFLLLDPKRADILRTFDNLSKQITENDNLLIFFAGHGYYDEQAELGYWLPADAEAEFTPNWIFNDVLVANLKRINSKHTLLICDACFSGSIFKTRSLMSNAPTAYRKKYELCSRKAITSGVLDQVPNKSVFFQYLIDYLETNQQPLMSSSELFRNIEIPIGNNSPNSPLYGVIQNTGDEGGDFIFIRRSGQ